jgi:hypothetical protein
MLEFAGQLYEELISKLKKLDNKDFVELYPAGERKDLIVLAIDRLKEKLRTYHFKDEEEEIFFFKYAMPDFLTLYIQDSEKKYLDVAMLMGSPRIKFLYLKKYFLEMNDFYVKNCDFMNYLSSGKTDLDQYYFLCADKFREENDELISEAMTFPVDMVYSLNIARIIAYETLRSKLDSYKPNDIMEAYYKDCEKDALVWTASKTDLTELIYCFKEAGCFNNGEADVKQIAEYFEYVFSIDLGNTSSTFQKILSRKKGQTTYIDKLRHHINRKIDDIDEGSLR